MKYKVLVCYKDKDGKLQQESAQLKVLTRKDAVFQQTINREVAEKKHGKANVISVDLIEE